MNKIHRVIWSDTLQTWVAAAETTSSKGKPASQRKRLQAAVSAALMAASTLGHAAPPAANALPTGGQVKSGTAGISQSGNTMDINQSTARAIINWNTFNIGSSAAVNFHQPDSSSVTLNRVLSSDPSAIYGRLSANGQVFLVNPGGVLFGAGSRVDVGGLVATTLSIRDEDFMAGNYLFSRDGALGSVVNQGELYGNYIALLAPEVRNEGVISAHMGTVALAAGDAVTLDISGNELIDVQVDKADIATLVENQYLIQADDGTVILSAQSANNLLGKVVNSGAIEATGIATDGGKVRLTASSNIEDSGSINVDAGANGKGGSATLIASLDNPDSITDISGTISAKGGSESGDGGFVETSGHHLHVDDSARIDTTAAHGLRGNWLIDPNDFTVAAAGGDITGTALGNALDTSNVSIQTTAGAASCTGATCTTGAAGNGDIIFNDAVYWTNSSSTLTLDAYRNIVFNKSVVRDTGMFGMPGPAIDMTYGSGGTGSAITTSTADWVTPFTGGVIAAGNMLIQDNTYGSPIVTPAVILGAHTGSPLDLYLGAKGVNIYVNATSGSSTYNGSSIPFLPSFSLDAPGASQIDIIPTLTAGVPTWNAANPKHAATTSGVLYTGGLSSTAYANLHAGTTAATWTVNAATLTPTLSNSAAQKTKTYNGTTAAPTGFTPTYSFSGLVFGDTAAALSNTGTTYTGASGQHAGAAGSNQLTVAGLAITGITGSNGSLAGDYTLAAPTVSAAATINPITLTATLTNSPITKIYDGTNAAPGGFTPTYSFTGSFLAGDTGATLGDTGITYNSAHVASANTLTVAGLSITAIAGGNGSMTTDYALSASSASHAATITPVQLTATLTNVGTTKVYDGTTDAPTGFTPTYSVTGTPVGTDTVNLLGRFDYDHKDVLTATTIGTANLSVGSVTGSSNGSLISDYHLTSASTSAAATITPATLSATAVGTKTDDGKDGIDGSLIKANGVNGEYFNFTGSGQLPATLVNVKASTSGNLANVNTLALDTTNGKNGAIASNYNAPPAYNATTDFNITVNSPASAQLASAVQNVTKLTWQQAYKKVLDSDRTVDSDDLLWGSYYGGDTSSSYDRYVTADKNLTNSDDYLNAKTVRLLLDSGWTAKDFKDQGIPISLLYATDKVESFSQSAEDLESTESVNGFLDSKSPTTTSKTQKVTTSTTTSAVFTREQLIAAGYSQEDVDSYSNTPEKKIEADDTVSFAETSGGKYSSTSFQSITADQVNQAKVKNDADAAEQAKTFEKLTPTQ